MSRPKLSQSVRIMTYCAAELERELLPAVRRSDRQTLTRLNERLFVDKTTLENLRTLHAEGKDLVNSDPEMKAQAEYLLAEARKRRIAFGQKADPLVLLFASEEAELKVLQGKLDAGQSALSKLDEVIDGLTGLREALKAGFSTH